MVSLLHLSERTFEVTPGGQDYSIHSGYLI